MTIGILGLGSRAGDQVIGNEMIQAWTGMSKDWVTERTGIYERRYSVPEQLTSDLAVAAAFDAMSAAGAADVSSVIVATSTGDRVTPATAVKVQERLGLSAGPAFDINAACSGFVYAVAVAAGMSAAPANLRTALVIGADQPSRIIDRGDRRTVSLFGDGAGAAVLGPVPDGYGLRSVTLMCDGRYYESVTVPPPDPGTGESPGAFLRMDGGQTRRYLLAAVPELVERAVAEAGWTLADVDRYAFHQANPRLIEEAANRLGIRCDRYGVIADRCGNTAAASVPMTLTEMHRRRPFRRGERLVLVSVGAGYTGGAIALVWH
jgi:3-oxoacyl-[acyl-carrier-protein] synthase-3